MRHPQSPIPSRSFCSDVAAPLRDRHPTIPQLLWELASLRRRARRLCSCRIKDFFKIALHERPAFVRLQDAWILYNLNRVNLRSGFVKLNIAVVVEVVAVALKETERFHVQNFRRRNNSFGAEATWFVPWTEAGGREERRGQ